ncbi:MAG: alpha-galactosidase, partial [Candidatus Neoclostridium sp.]
MAIAFDENNKLFYLESNNTSYVIQITRFGTVGNLYYGKKIGRDDVRYLEYLRDRGSEVAFYGAPERKYSPNVIPDATSMAAPKT